MPPSLTWLDHDAHARERSLRILALFKEKESRDELGIGGIRDAISDQLFPGTSTIQTRLRYMLIVPWVYTRLEAEQIPAKAFASRARQEELSVVTPLLDAREEGVFGSQAGSGLKRLPSSVYWAGLGTWGIRRFPAAQSDYHRAVDVLYARRARSRHREDDDADSDPGSRTWHPRLPPPPEGFPKDIDLKLTTDEAGFLGDCIQRSCPGTLLAWLALHGVPDLAPEPWVHTQLREFPSLAQELIANGRRFTDLIEGAARVYNLVLAELREHDGWTAEHRAALGRWRDSLDLAALAAWSLPHFWELTVGRGHDITPATRRFVEAILDRVLATGGNVAEDASMRALVSRREQTLKGPRSRITNRGARQQWGGNAGTGRVVYRWPTARRLLADLYPALGRT